MRSSAVPVMTLVWFASCLAAAAQTNAVPLEALKSAYEAKLKQAADNCEADLRSVSRRYADALQVLRTSLRESGDTEGAAACDKEASRFEAEKMVPNDPPADLNKSLRQPQAHYRSLVANALAMRASADAGAAREYLRGLRRLAAETAEAQGAASVEAEIRRAEKELPAFDAAALAVDVQTGRRCFLTNKFSGKMLGIVDSPDNGATVLQWDSLQGKPQQDCQVWKVAAAEQGCFKLACMRTGKLLTTASSLKDGGHAGQWEDVGAAPDTVKQQWRFVAAGGDYYKLVNRHSGKLLTLVGSKENGQPVRMWQDMAGKPDETKQYWRLVLMGE